MKHLFRKISISTPMLLAATIVGSNACAQGSFQNLGFENPILPLVPDASGFVLATNAIPGWTPYLGSLAGIGVLYNDIYLGTAVVDLIGPEYTNAPIVIDGGYSVVLQAGVNPLTGTSHIAVAIGQTGLIPLGTRSISLKAAGFLQPGTLEVDIGGQNVSLAAVSSTSTYTVYAGDVSQFAGQTADLRVAAVPTPINTFANWIIDDIQFSASAIPEPSTVGLLVIGAAMAGWRLAVRRR